MPVEHKNFKDVTANEGVLRRPGVFDELIVGCVLLSATAAYHIITDMNN